MLFLRRVLRICYDFLIDPGFTHVTDPQQPASVTFSDEGDDGILLLAEE
jgi:hypothetical protein